MCDVGVHSLLRFDVVVDYLVVILGEEAVNLAHFEAYALHVLATVVLTLLQVSLLMRLRINLLLEVSQVALIEGLVLTLPDLSRGDALIELVKHFVLALVLIEACLHLC